MALPGAAPRHRRGRRGLFRAYSLGVRLLHHHFRRMAIARRTVHRRGGQQISMVPVARDRRAHQSLRPDRAALRRLRFRPLQPRRPGHGLAHHLRGHRPLLRQGRKLHRRDRKQGRHPQRAGRHFPALPGPASARTPGAARRQEAQHPLHSFAPGGDHQADQRPAAVPLLRAMRARLRDRVELFFEPGPAVSRHEDRARQGVHQRHGARAGDGRRRQSGVRVLHRQDHAQREADPVPHGGAGLRSLRIRPAAAEFQSPEVFRMVSPTARETSAGT